MACANVTRREWLRHAAWAAAAAAAAPSLLAGRGARGESAGGKAGPAAAPPPAPGRAGSRVALTAGDNRADNVMRALRTFEKEIAQAIGSRRAVIKPNNVGIDTPLCATHADCIQAILEFLKSIGKLDGAIVAESPASGPAAAGFDNYGYRPVAAKYGAKLVDLDAEGFEIVQVLDERDLRPHPVRMSKVLLDGGAFIISACKPKTHDRVVATLSLKNIVVGAAIKYPGFGGRGGRGGLISDKPTVHGGGHRGTNYNLFAVGQRLHPHLAVIDAFDGMEGNGPIGGRPVDHRVCVVSPDWLAADRVGVELMGIDFAKVGYLNYSAAAGMGEADLKKIEIVGEPIARHVKPYKLADNIEEQLIWMKPVRNP